MEKRKFLEETNFADEIEEIKPEDWDAEASNKAIRAHQERIWSDANLRDGSYWPVSQAEAPKGQKRHSSLALLLVWTANYATTKG